MLLSAEQETTGERLGGGGVAVIFWLMGTLMAPFRGFVDATVGIVPVVKLHAKLAANAAPLGFWAPVVTVAAYTVFAASKFVGVKVAVVPA
jgi:hypothetical protein